MASPVMDEEDLTEEELGRDELLPHQVAGFTDMRSRVSHLLNS